MITSFMLELSGATPGSPVQDALDALALGVVGTRYETLEGAEGNMDDIPVELVREVLAWLRAAM
jgi:hypothetical protein